MRRRLILASLYTIILTFSITSPSATLASHDEGLPVPIIAFEGKSISGQSNNDVAIGQIITLYASESGATDLWSFTGAALVFRSFYEKRSCPKSTGSDAPGTHFDPSGCIDYGVVDLHSNKTTFYFVQPGRYTITYSYSINGKSQSTYTIINVHAPAFPDPISVIDQVNLIPLGCTAACSEMDLGDHRTAGRYGITNSATASPLDGFPGHLLWVQVIDDLISYTEASGDTAQCEVANGLDANAFPYPAHSPGSMVDIPYFEFGKFIGVSRTFVAYDTLMWKADVQGDVEDSVPVALGSVMWGFYGSAAYVSNASQKTWMLQSRTVTRPVFRRGWYAVNWGSYTEAMICKYLIAKT